MLLSIKKVFNSLPCRSKICIWQIFLTPSKLIWLLAGLGKNCNLSLRSTTEEIIELKDDERREFYISFDESVIYKSRVVTRQWKQLMDIDRVKNVKHTITFIDEKLILAKGKNFRDDDGNFTTDEIEINLELSATLKRWSYFFILFDKGIMDTNFFSDKIKLISNFFNDKFIFFKFT